jgi:Rieske Fe-S protein
MENVSQSRRKFITAIALLIASGGALVRFLTPRAANKQRILVRAASADVPVNGALIFRNERLALLRDEKGFYALSLICTHLGCTVTVTENRLSCPCHGSVFDRQGRVLKGPADRALARLEVVEKSGEIKVYGS